MMRKQHRFLPKIGLTLCLPPNQLSIFFVFFFCWFHDNIVAVTKCLQFMLEVEDDPDWLTADVINDDEDLEG